MGKLMGQDDLLYALWRQPKKDIRICISLLVIVPMGYGSFGVHRDGPVRAKPECEDRPDQASAPQPWPVDEGEGRLCRTTQ